MNNKSLRKQDTNDRFSLSSSSSYEGGGGGGLTTVTGVETEIPTMSKAVSSSSPTAPMKRDSIDPGSDEDLDPRIQVRHYLRYLEKVNKFLSLFILNWVAIITLRCFVIKANFVLHLNLRKIQSKILLKIGFLKRKRFQMKSKSFVLAAHIL